MKFPFSFLLTLTLILPLFSCSHTTNSEQARSTATTANGLLQSKRMAWLQLDALYKPTDYLLAQDLQRNRTPSLSTEDLRAAYDQMHYIDLRLSTPDKPGSHIENYGVYDEATRQQRLQYLSFTMKDDLYLLQNGQKIPCELFHFERNYGLSPHRTFVCGFPKKGTAPDEDITLVLESEYLQTGPLKIAFSAQDLQQSAPLTMAR